MNTTNQAAKAKVAAGLKTPSRELSDFRPIHLTVIEGDEGGNGKVRVRGEFARADAATQNGRVYPKNLWEREIGRLSADLRSRKVFGELDHPADGRTSLSRVSHVVTSLTVEADGTVTGEAEILDTARGKDLKALLKGNCAVGVSSRGYGSTQTMDDGKEKVQEDYRLGTFDFVAEPADSGAYPTTFFESKERRKMDANEKPEQVEESTVNEEEVTKRVSAAVSEATSQVESQLRDEFAQKLPLLLAKVKADVREEVRGELLSDPAVAGAKVALESVKALLRPYILPEDVEGVLSEKDAEISRLRKTLADKDLKMKDIEEEMEKLSFLAKTTGYKYFLEKNLGDSADAAIVRAAIGDVSGYTDLTSLKARLESVQREIGEKREKVRLDEEKRSAEIDSRVAAERAKLEEQLQVQASARDSMVTREKDLQETVEKLNEALEKSMLASKLQALQLYGERKITGHPRAAEVRKILENSRFSTQDEVDEIIESVHVASAPANGGDDQEALRARVRRLTRGGISSTPVEEEKPRVKLQESTDYNGLGLGVEQIKKLSGIG